MTLFNEELVQDIMMFVQERYAKLGGVLGEEEVVMDRKLEGPFCMVDAFIGEDIQEKRRGSGGGEESQLEKDMRLLVEVANGRHERTDRLMNGVEMALARVLDALLGNALMGQIVVPDDFWKTEIGLLVSRVRWWLSVDDLITISNAAALAFGENTQANRMRIGRAMDKGLLDWVPDPSVANPQQNKRVLRPQVERLRDLRRLPE